MIMGKKNQGITLITLIITIIIMLILVGVSIQLVINSGLFDSAKNASIKTEEAYKNESAIGTEITIDGTTYSSTEEYIKQLNCSHEWGEWNKNPENCLGKRTCKKCGKLEISQLPHIFENGTCIVCGHELVIGAYIEGYDPSIAENGSIINTRYTSEGVTGNGTIEGGASGNGYGNQTFTVNSITKWRILGEENGQIVITTADPIQVDGETNYYLRGQAGYVNCIDELNKISSIYGQGKYADTSKYSYDINETTIVSGGRSIKLEDIGCKINTTPITKTYTKNSETGYIDTDGISDSNNTNTSFTYWGEDAEPSQGKVWKTLKSGESVRIKRYSYTVGGRTTKQNEMILKTSDGSTNALYWIASKFPSCDSGYAAFKVNLIGWR